MQSAKQRKIVTYDFASTLVLAKSECLQYEICIYRVMLASLATVLISLSPRPDKLTKTI